VIIFSSVWFLYKKNNQTDFFKKKSKPVQTDRFQFGFLGQKPVQTGLALFLSGLVRVFFPVWVRFSFRLIKPKPNRPVFLKF